VNADRRCETHSGGSVYLPHSPPGQNPCFGENRVQEGGVRQILPTCRSRATQALTPLRLASGRLQTNQCASNARCGLFSMRRNRRSAELAALHSPPRWTGRSPGRGLNPRSYRRKNRKRPGGLTGDGRCIDRRMSRQDRAAAPFGLMCMPRARGSAPRVISSRCARSRGPQRPSISWTNWHDRRFRRTRSASARNALSSLGNAKSRRECKRVSPLTMSSAIGFHPPSRNTWSEFRSN